MHPALDENLALDFPNLYRERHGDRNKRMSDGFPGDGWEPLIRRMSETLEPFCRETDLRCAQIKEKGGLLRVYLEPSESIPDAARAAIGEAVEESSRTCEGCGEPGRLRRGRWARTLCDSCAAFAEEYDRRRFGNTRGDDEWREQFRGQFGRVLDFEGALRKSRERIKPPPGDEARYKWLLARRIPREQIVPGCVYIIHARNAGVGVAVEEGGHIGYRLHRTKFDEHYLDTEWDWDQGPPHGTAIPLRLLDVEPPTNDDDLLEWLAVQMDEHRDEIYATWEKLLGSSIKRPPKRSRSDK